MIGLRQFAYIGGGNSIDVTCLDDRPRARPPREWFAEHTQVYQCRCGWIGTEGEMEADAACYGEGWSNWICPSCQRWWQLADYVRLNPP